MHTARTQRYARTQRHVRNATNTDTACAVRWGLAWKSVSRLCHPPPFPPPSRQVRVQAPVGKGVVGSSEHDIFSYIKMHFSYVKSNILRRWLNMLRNYVHTRTFFTPKIHPPPITRPATRPGPPPIRPAIPPGPPPHPACHPTQPAATPCLRPHSCCPFSPGHDGVAIVATRWCRPRRSAKAVCVG